MPSLRFHQYGKTNVRLSQVLRTAERHDIAELSITVRVRGDFEKSYTDADNSIVLPTDTMKNTVYVLARQHPIASVESFALRLATHFLSRLERLSEIEIAIEQRTWARIGAHPSAFMLGGTEQRTTQLIAARDRQTLTSGFRGLEVLKTGDSAFADFQKDEFTTLAETQDRLLGTVIDAEWVYSSIEVDFNAEYEQLRAVLLETFAAHISKSVQHTLYDMAAAALESSASVNEVHLVMPNKHRILVDLSKFGLDNPNQIFIPIDEPSGYIEARVTADGAGRSESNK